MSDNREIKFIKHKLGGITAIYTIIDGIATFTIVPTKKLPKVDYDKLTLKDVKYNRPDPMVQVSVFGDEVNRQYSPGQTMRNTESCFALKFSKQKKTKKDSITTIVTELVREDGQKAKHHIVWDGGSYLECFVTYYNGSKNDITLEMLASFSLGSLSPFVMDQEADKFSLHRMRSQWSAEAILETMSAEDLLMEPSWMNYGVRGDRFGQRGSFPARPFIPFIAATDDNAKVTWAANIYCPTSWQAEYYLSQNSINLSGGLADFEFGHWRKILKPKESITTPVSLLTTIVGDVNEAAQLLTLKQNTYKLPPSEDSLPVMYNDWCKNWGKCTKENLIPLINATADFGIEYFVIDAGWYNKTDCDSNPFAPNIEIYPNGFEEIVGLIKNKGMRAGVWFEFESRDYDGLKDSFKDLLTRDGLIIRNLERAFVDMRSSDTREVLRKGVIDFFGKYGVGYTKIDYNENIGIGCDGAESLGEGLRQHGLASHEFFKEMTETNPDLVVEICASGGMRAEPSMIALGSQMSFSDIHETDEGPIVAAAMHRVLQPRRNQIWATVRRDDSERRIINTISKTFLGRMCFSGDIAELDKKQNEIVKKSIALYRKCVPAIKDGTTYFLTPQIKSMRNPKGHQAVLRRCNDGKTAVLTIHTFDESCAKGIKLSNNLLKGYEITESFCESAVTTELDGKGLRITNMGKFSGAVFLLNNMK